MKSETPQTSRSHHREFESFHTTNAVAKDVILVRSRDTKLRCGTFRERKKTGYRCNRLIAWIRYTVKLLREIRRECRRVVIFMFFAIDGMESLHVGRSRIFNGPLYSGLSVNWAPSFVLRTTRTK